MACAGGIAQVAEPDGNPAAVSELRGIAEEVRRDLAEGVRVAEHRAARLGVDVELQVHPLGGDVGAGELHRLLEHGGGLEGDRRQLHRPGFDPRDVEQAVDHVELGVGGGEQQVHHLAGLVVELVHLQQLGEADDAAEQHAQLVADVAQELGLGDVRGLRPSHGYLERPGGAYQLAHHQRRDGAERKHEGGERQQEGAEHRMPGARRRPGEPGERRAVGAGKRRTVLAGSGRALRQRQVLKHVEGAEIVEQGLVHPVPENDAREVLVGGADRQGPGLRHDAGKGVEPLHAAGSGEGRHHRPPVEGRGVEGGVELGEDMGLDDHGGGLRVARFIEAQGRRVRPDDHDRLERAEPDRGADVAAHPVEVAGADVRECVVPYGIVEDGRARGADGGFDAADNGGAERFAQSRVLRPGDPPRAAERSGEQQDRDGKCRAQLAGELGGELHPAIRSVTHFILQHVAHCSTGRRAARGT